jgi:hypothetical protein
MARLVLQEGIVVWANKVREQVVHGRFGEGTARKWIWATAYDGISQQCEGTTVSVRVPI